MRGISKFLVATAAVAVSSATAGAQGWVSMASGGTLQNTWSQTAAPTRAYWNNASDDNTGLTNGCNIGFVLSGDATTANCVASNQRPAAWLPFSGARPNSFLASGANGQSAVLFMFEKGLYDISLLGLGKGGDVAQNNQDWGIFSGGSIFEGASNLGGNVNLNSPTTTFSRVFNFSASWGLWINTVDIGNVFSDGTGANGNRARNFGVFSAGANPALTTASGVTTVGFTPNSPMYFGLEDRSCAPNVGPANCTFSDFDLNDVVGRITAVPEPSTYALMATGLIAMGLVARRRRNV